MSSSKLTPKQFKLVSEYIRSEVGINITVVKQVMLETRLRKRITATKHDSFESYINFLFSPEGQRIERELFINAVTTNKTDFFREPHHFEFMTNTAIPELLSNKRNRLLRVWSSACSIGAEPYTLAIVLEEYKKKHATDLHNYEIYATDISTKVLRHAHKGIYSQSDMQPVAKHLQHKYIMKSNDKNSDAVRIVPELRRKITFKHLNLMHNFSFTKPIDIIFCRNVMIYFEKETQVNLVNRLIKQLTPGGYLFMGHSEVLEPHKFGLTACAPSVYQKR